MTRPERPGLREALQRQKARLLARGYIEHEGVPSWQRYPDVPVQGRRSKAASLSQCLRTLGCGARSFFHERYLGLHDQADWTGVAYDLQRFFVLFSESLRRDDVPVYCSLARLRTMADTADHREQHRRGCAIDVRHAYCAELTDHEWKWLGVRGEQIIAQHNLPIRNGCGDFAVHDYWHWELRDWEAHPWVPPDQAPTRYTPRGLRTRLAVADRKESKPSY